MIAWFVTTLQQNAELAIFVALGIGYAVGPLKLGGFNLGNVTACLLAGVLVGQLNVPIAAPLRAFAFALFLFAVGYKVCGATASRRSRSRSSRASSCSPFSLPKLPSKAHPLRSTTSWPRPAPIHSNATVNSTR
jgi:hypothetical protein